MALQANLPDPAQEAAQAKAKAAADKAKARAAATPVQPCKACNNRCKELYEKHKDKIAKAKEKLTPQQQRDLDAFTKHYEANKGIYQSISDQTDIPPELIAVQHWREGSGNFNTYLTQGDPLGRPPRQVPTDWYDPVTGKKSQFPTYQKGEFEKAAVKGLDDKLNRDCQKALGITKDTKDKAAMAAYLERWNGTGYTDHNHTNPYIYSGTDQYTQGKYVKDHKYSPTAIDGQLGAIPMLNSILPQDPPYLDDTNIPPKDSTLYNPAKSS